MQQEDLPSKKNKLIHPNHPQHSAGHPTGTLKQKQSGQNIQNKKQAKSFTFKTLQPSISTQWYWPENQRNTAHNLSK